MRRHSPQAAVLTVSKHVAYPAEGAFDQGGKCPETHPKRLPALFYEMFYNVRTNPKANVRDLTCRTSRKARSMCRTLACWPTETISDALCTVRAPWTVREIRMN